MARERTRLFVGGIPFEMQEKELLEVLQQAGPVVSFRLVIDKDTKRSKGYGFAEYRDYASASQAIKVLHGYEINGRALRVDFSENDKGGPMDRIHGDRERDRDRANPNNMPRDIPNNTMMSNNMPNIPNNMSNMPMSNNMPNNMSNMPMSNMPNNIPPNMANILSSLPPGLLASLPPNVIQALANNPGLAANLGNLGPNVVEILSAAMGGRAPANPMPANPVNNIPNPVMPSPIVAPPVASAQPAPEPQTPVDPVEMNKFLDSVLNGLTTNQFIEILSQLKNLIQTNPEARKIMVASPPLTYVLLRIEAMLGLVPPTQIQDILRNSTFNSNMNEQPTTAAPVQPEQSNPNPLGNMPGLPMMPPGLSPAQQMQFVQQLISSLSPEDLAKLPPNHPAVAILQAAMANQNRGF